MTDTFSRVCAIVFLFLLAGIAFRPIRSQTDSRDSSTQFLRYPFEKSPDYKVFEIEPDAKQINEILSKYANEGNYQLAAAPIVKAGDREKVILVLVQHRY